jgi:MerR family transcriptional regulator/heat shock protein HspR
MAKRDDTVHGRQVTRRTRAARYSRRVEASIDSERGVFMISVAAELADMHPQTLRMYETRGLITPKRSPKKTRLYSQNDVERLRRIQRMTSEDGLNLAGVEAVLKMEDQVSRMRAELERMRKRAKELEREMNAEVERVRRSLKAEIVPYGAYDTAHLVPARQTRPIRIPVKRPGKGS